MLKGRTALILRRRASAVSKGEGELSQPRPAADRHSPSAACRAATNLPSPISVHLRMLFLAASQLS